MTKLVLLASALAALRPCECPAAAPASQVADCGELEEIRINGGLATFLEKLKGGRDVTVCYFGGSITEGSSYRPPFTEWLRARYPSARIREINAGIGGTGSNLGVYRLEHDVLRHDPDLVFVEFALNDGDRSSVEPDRISANVEAIVRGIWRHDPAADVVFLYTISRKLAETFRKGRLTREAAVYDAVAARYRIPTVNFAPRVLARERAGKLVWTLGDAPTAVPKEDPDYDRKVGAEMTAKGMLVFSNDGVHPRAEGGRLYVEALTNLFSRPMPKPDAGSRPNLVAAAPFSPDPCLSPTSVELTRGMLQGRWRSVAAADPAFGRFLARTDSMWRADRPGDRLTFSFTGAEASIYALYGPSAARLNVWVDGRRLPARDLCDRYCTYWWLMRVPIFRGERGRHEVTLEIAAEQPDREAVREFRKLTDEQVRKIGFDGHCLAVGRLLIDGRIADGGD